MSSAQDKIMAKGKGKVSYQPVLVKKVGQTPSGNYLLTDPLTHPASCIEFLMIIYKSINSSTENARKPLAKLLNKYAIPLQILQGTLIEFCCCKEANLSHPCMIYAIYGYFNRFNFECTRRFFRQLFRPTTASFN
jgi:hypothetical protein